MKRKNKSDKGDSKKKQFTGVLKYSGLAFQMITIILIVLYGGMKLDEYLENEFPLFTFLGAISGVVLSLYVVLKDLLNKK